VKRNKPDKISSGFYLPGTGDNGFYLAASKDRGVQQIALADYSG
jgi:hypothetical protein